VPHEIGGTAQGQLLVLDVQQKSLDEVHEWLWETEGSPARELLKQMTCDDFACVLYCDLEATLKDEEITPESLPKFAN
jgi:hypothetical protein